MPRRGRKDPAPPFSCRLPLDRRPLIPLNAAMDPTIAFVSSLPGWGGGEKWFLDAARALHVRGRRVLVVGQPGSELVARAAAAGLRTAGVRMAGILDPRTLWTLGRLLRREGVRLAVTNQAREIRLVGLSQLGRRGFRQIARRGSPDPVKDVWHFRLVYRHLVHRLIVNCEALVPRVLDGAPWFDRRRVVVLPNGVDADALNREAAPGRLASELGLSPDTHVVVMAGEIGPRKDQETLLRAAALWRERSRRAGAAIDVVFLIAGAGPPSEERRLRALTRELGLDDGTVRWLGFRRDVPSLLALAELLALPTREEGFPNTVIEAMALGVPVVATPVDGIPEVITDGETGLLVPPGDPEALAAALARLLGDPPLRARLAAAAAGRVRTEFDHERLMDRLRRADRRGPRLADALE